MDLVTLWVNYLRIVGADSHFILVTAADLLCKNEFEFIGVVKIAMRNFLKAYLAAQELENRGDTYGLVRGKGSEEECDVLV